MQLSEINKILKENKDIFKDLENYDKNKGITFSKKKNRHYPISKRL